MFQNREPRTNHSLHLFMSPAHPPDKLQYKSWLQYLNLKGERKGVKSGYISRQERFLFSRRVQRVLICHRSHCWGTRARVLGPSCGHSALQPLLPPPFFVWFEESLLRCGLSFSRLISLERAQGFVFSAVWRYLGRRVLASSDIWICQQNSYPHPSASAEKAHRAMSVGSYFHQSVKLPAFRQSSSNFKVCLIPHQIITAIPRSTLSPELSIWRRTETYWCPLWKQHGCQAD